MIWLEGFFGVGRCKTLVADLPCFWAQWLSKKNILLWRDLWDCSSRSWKDWCALAHEYALSLADRPIVMDIVSVIARDSIQDEHRHVGLLLAILGIPWPSTFSVNCTPFYMNIVNYT